jgi:hypothetical protein
MNRREVLKAVGLATLATAVNASGFAKTAPAGGPFCKTWQTTGAGYFLIIFPGRALGLYGTREQLSNGYSSLSQPLNCEICTM